MRFPLVSVGVLTLVGVGLAQAPVPKDLKLRGDRFKPLKYEELTPEQKTMVEHLYAGERGGMNGPFNVTLRSPKMGDLAQQLGAELRFHSALTAKQRELAIILTGREWTAQYEWYAHSRLALQAGIPKDAVDAIAAGKKPTSLGPDEVPVYNFVSELLKTKQVSDPVFQAARDKLGEKGVVDLTGLVTYYGFVCAMLNIDRYPLPDNAEPELKPLR